jgi:hypothetical protein
MKYVESYSLYIRVCGGVWGVGVLSNINRSQRSGSVMNYEVRKHVGK